MSASDRTSGFKWRHTHHIDTFVNQPVDNVDHDGAALVRQLHTGATTGNRVSLWDALVHSAIVNRMGSLWNSKLLCRYHPHQCPCFHQHHQGYSFTFLHCPNHLLLQQWRIPKQFTTAQLVQILKGHLLTDCKAYIRNDNFKHCKTKIKNIYTSWKPSFYHHCAQLMNVR